MAKYLVEITETLSRTYAVEAESKENAVRIIENAVNESKIILDADDFVSRDIEIVSYDVNADGIMICKDVNYLEYYENDKTKG